MMTEIFEKFIQVLFKKPKYKVYTCVNSKDHILLLKAGVWDYHCTFFLQIRAQLRILKIKVKDELNILNKLYYLDWQVNLFEANYI